MKALYDQISVASSKLITRNYSTSFSTGIYLLARKYHAPVYSIYGFVRLADEIVDTFHDQDKALLLKEFRTHTYQAIERRISLNPVLHAFQGTVHQYGIERELIDTFLDSMEMDLRRTEYDRLQYDKYIVGSAEVVGLMCLRVFCEGDNARYEELKHPAMKLGAAFQKINFLRDIKADYEHLGRSYFPGVDVQRMSPEEKRTIETEILADFEEGLRGIRQLPKGARRGVYVAYVYYRKLFDKISSLPPTRLIEQRIRIHNSRKMVLLVRSLFRLRMNAI
ncbi:MAG: phytoene/squalene synthase family protein [Saprospiraceae bacterium]|nr:phytoene/squalene synthase family protein [Saprospiraceae bacterium]